MRDRARSTSATPTYFEPYKHPETERIYTDGALEIKIPVQLADNESKFIWPKESEHMRDIVVSIGTGCSTDFDGMLETDPKLSSFLEGLQHLGLARKIAMLKSMLQFALDCERT